MKSCLKNNRFGYNTKQNSAYINPSFLFGFQNYTFNDIENQKNKDIGLCGGENCLGVSDKNMTRYLNYVPNLSFRR